MPLFRPTVGAHEGWGGGPVMGGVDPQTLANLYASQQMASAAMASREGAEEDMQRVDARMSMGMLPPTGEFEEIPLTTEPNNGFLDLWGVNQNR